MLCFMVGAIGHLLTFRSRGFAASSRSGEMALEIGVGWSKVR